MRRNQGSHYRGRKEPRSQTALCNEILTSSLMWFSVGCTRGVCHPGLTSFIPWCGGVVWESQPCWFVYSLSVGLGNHQWREFACVLLEGESVWSDQISFARLIKGQCIDDCPFFIPRAPKSPIFRQENPLLLRYFPSFQRESKQTTIYFFPSRGKCWLNWILRATASWHLVLKEFLTALSRGSKRVYKKSRSVESKSQKDSTEC